MKCGLCGSGITAQEKFKKILGQTEPKSYVYYHCTKFHDARCKNPMIREDALILQLLEMMDDIDINTVSVSDSLNEEIRRYNIFQSQLLKKDSRDIIIAKKINLREYMKYIIANGSKDEKREVLSMIQADIILTDKIVWVNKYRSQKTEKQDTIRTEDFPATIQDTQELPMKKWRNTWKMNTWEFWKAWEMPSLKVF